MGVKKIKKRTMKRTLAGASILQGLREALAIAKGEAVPHSQTTVFVPQVNPREIREKTGLSQREFALKFGFTFGSVRGRVS